MFAMSGNIDGAGGHTNDILCMRVHGHISRAYRDVSIWNWCPKCDNYIGVSVRKFSNGASSNQCYFG